MGWLWRAPQQRMETSLFKALLRACLFVNAFSLMARGVEERSVWLLAVLEPYPSPLRL